MFDLALQRFGALSHDIRLSVFRLLIKAGADGVTAGEIARQINVPASTLSSHLNRLEQAGLIFSTREQQKIVYAVSIRGTQDLVRFLLEDCCSGNPELCGFKPVRTRKQSYPRKHS